MANLRSTDGAVLKFKMDELLGTSDGYINHSNFLFHYAKAETALAYVLRSKTLKFNALGSTNDPLENNPLVHVGTRNVPTDENGSTITEGYQLRALTDERKKGKLACFCVTPESKKISGLFDWGCFRSRMWSQYADRHRGVCLVFSKSELLVAVNEWTCEKDIEFFDGRVVYNNKLEKLREAIAVSEAELPSARIKRHHEGYYFCKREDYRDEAEYRAVVYCPDLLPENVAYIPYKESLRGIILGAEFPRENNDLFIEEARSLDIALAQVEWYSDPIFRTVDSCWLPLHWKNCWRILFRLKHKLTSYFKYRSCRAAA